MSVQLPTVKGLRLQLTVRPARPVRPMTAAAIRDVEASQPSSAGHASDQSAHEGSQALQAAAPPPEPERRSGPTLLQGVLAIPATYIGLVIIVKSIRGALRKG